MGLKELIERWKGDDLREVLRKMYVDEGLNQTQIAEKLLVSQSIVSVWLEEYGIVDNKDLFTKEKYYKHTKVRLKDDDEFRGKKTGSK